MSTFIGAFIGLILLSAIVAGFFMLVAMAVRKARYEARHHDHTLRVNFDEPIEDAGELARRAMGKASWMRPAGM